MHRTVVGAVALFVLAVSVQASQIEDATGIAYQDDGHQGRDAPDACLDFVGDVATHLNVTTEGMMVDEDDEVDVYAFELGQEDIGTRVFVSVSGFEVQVHDITFDILDASCTESVFDPNARFYQPPPPESGEVPETLFEDREGYATFSGRVDKDYTCTDDQWRFLANQMHGEPAPVSIFALWSDGNWEYVGLDKDTPATLAQYTTSNNLAFTLEAIAIQLPVGYSGQFQVVEGPCGATEYQPPQPPEAPIIYSPTSAEFTVVEAGTYVTVVTLTKGLDEYAVENVETVVDIATDPPTAIGVPCHVDGCALASGNILYTLQAAPTA